MRKRDTPSQIVEHDQENNLPDMEIQLPMSLHQNHENETFEDKNSARKDVRQNGTGPANENSLIQEQSYSTSMEDCKGFKETRHSLVNKGKQNATPNLQIQILEEGQTKASSCSLEPTKDFQPGHDDNGAISMSHNRHQKKDPAKLRKQNVTPNLEIQILGVAQAEESSSSLAPTQEVQPGKDNGAISISQNPQQESEFEDRASHVIERHPQDESLPPMEGNSRKKRRTLGKTQRRLAKLLKEGKAAVDVIIIIDFLVLRYLPLWIMGCYRAFGGDPSAEAILTSHCFYQSTMVWNPIIYSIRKKEFRKAVRKVLKL